MYIETIRKGFPDCIAKRYIGSGKWEEVLIEFEFKSSDFVRHRHLDQMKKKGTVCDMIVCWEHDWKECPKDIEVIELKEEYLNHDNEIVEEPDKVSQISEGNIEDLYKGKKSKELFKKFDEIVTNLNKDVWKKITKRVVVYYSPEKAFAFVRIQKQGVKAHIFTNSKKIQGVEQFDYDEAGHKWGRLYVRSTDDITKAENAMKKSLELIKKAIKNNENTGWYAKIEGE